MYIDAGAFELYICITTICLLNSAYQLRVCLCRRIHVLDIYVYVSWCPSVSMYIVRLKYVYIYCHYLSTPRRLPTGGVLVWTKSLFDTYICVWYIYIHIVTICLPNSACLLGVWLCGRSHWRSRVLDIYILPVFIYSTPLADRECAYVDNVAISSWYVYVCLIYMRIEHILPLSVYSTPLADRECDCVDEVACSMYVYVSMVIVATVYTYCRYLMYTCV